MSSSSSGIAREIVDTKITGATTLTATVAVTQSTTSVQTMNAMPHVKPIITTAEVIMSTKKKSTATEETTTASVTLPAKRGRGFTKPHTLMSFANEEAFKMYLECGQLKNQNVSPCVDRSALKKYPMVFEEWQEHSTGTSTNKRWYRCRRQRGYRRAGLGIHERPTRAKRQLKNKKEYIGCGCQARFRKMVCLLVIPRM